MFKHGTVPLNKAVIFRMEVVMPGNKELNFKEAFDISLSIGNKIDVYWRQFFIVTFALFAWSSSNIQIKIPFVAAGAITLCIIIFYSYNAAALYRIYQIMIISIMEVREATRNSLFNHDQSSENILDCIKMFKFKSRVRMAFISHAMSAGAMLYMTWYGYLKI